MKPKQIDHHCGNCCFFKFEDTNGDGTCVKHYWDTNKEGDDPMFTNCSNEACEDFISNEEKLQHFRELLIIKEEKLAHFQELLINKETLDAVTKSDNALYFAINYIKTFNKL